MLPDRVSNPGPLTYESGAQPIALRGPAYDFIDVTVTYLLCHWYRTMAGNVYPAPLIFNGIIHGNSLNRNFGFSQTNVFFFFFFFLFFFSQII